MYFDTSAAQRGRMYSSGLEIWVNGSGRGLYAELTANFYLVKYLGVTKGGR